MTKVTLSESDESCESAANLRFTIDRLLEFFGLKLILHKLIISCRRASMLCASLTSGVRIIMSAMKVIRVGSATSWFRLGPGM